MRRKFLFLSLVCTVQCFAQQKLVSGPWAGNVELRTAMIWLEVTPDVKKVAVQYFSEKDSAVKKTIFYQGALGRAFNPVKIGLNRLETDTRYRYRILLDEKPVNLPFKTAFTTKDLWQYRKPVPDFSFLTGSCAYFNEPQFDRPGKPYGGDSSIFTTMSKMGADFHVWLGDNWYSREVDYTSEWGLNYRASRDRSLPVLQEFMASMPQYAIWDDHDYGPNDAGKSYILKKESRNIFSNYWLNPSCGENDKGIYTMYSYADMDLFLTDDRYFRAADDLPDSINGSWNQKKSFFGEEQMEWLKNALLFSRATFKIIVVGSQVLNPFNQYECMRHYSYEYQQLMQFLSDQKINGVVFLTGDRHHSEVIKMSRENNYALYDITVSPYTSGVSKVSGAELNNPFRVPNTLVEAANFAKIACGGEKNNRVMQVSFFGIHGEKLGEWSIGENELKAK